MMKRSIFTTTVAAIALLNASTVLASDYNSGVVTKTPSEVETPVEFGSGWYIRGDIGTGFDGDADVSFTRAARSGDVDAESDADYTLGIGFGYIFNDNLRADMTFDVFSGGNWSGSASGCGVDGLGVPYTGSCSSSDRGEFESHNAMVNAYFSLGTFGGFKPYVGGGVGLAHVQLSGIRSVASCALDPGETCDLGVNGGATPTALTGPSESFRSDDSVNLVYSLVVGLDYRIDEFWTADFGYRYTNITDESVVGSLTTTDTAEFDGFEIHEVRAGLRYDIW
ncbi:MAG: outer membrane beta-barrel protein [Rhizobiaceae bacterium]